jgi:hypothetical protein
VKAGIFYVPRKLCQAVYYGGEFPQRDYCGLCSNDSRYSGIDIEILISPRVQTKDGQCWPDGWPLPEGV